MTGLIVLFWITAALLTYWGIMERTENSIFEKPRPKPVLFILAFISGLIAALIQAFTS